MPTDRQVTPVQVILGDYLGDVGVIKRDAAGAHFGIRVEIVSSGVISTDFTETVTDAGRLWNRLTGPAGTRHAVRYPSEWSQVPAGDMLATMTAAGVTDTSLATWWEGVALATALHGAWPNGIDLDWRGRALRPVRVPALAQRPDLDERVAQVPGEQPGQPGCSAADADPPILSPQGQREARVPARQLLLIVARANELGWTVISIRRRAQPARARPPDQAPRRRHTLHRIRRHRRRLLRDPGEEISQSTRDWVEGFVPTGPGRYIAHITVGFATLDDLKTIEADPFDPFPIQPTSLAVYLWGA